MINRAKFDARASSSFRGPKKHKQADMLTGTHPHTNGKNALYSMDDFINLKSFDIHFAAFRSLYLLMRMSSSSVCMSFVGLGHCDR